MILDTTGTPGQGTGRQAKTADRLVAPGQPESDRTMASPETDPRRADRARTTPELCRISWRRARRFPPYSADPSAARRSTPGWLVPLIWPTFIVSSAWEAPWIRTLPGASATVESSPPGRGDSPAKRAGRIFLVLVLAAMAAVLAGVALISDLIAPDAALVLVLLLLIGLTAVWAALLSQSVRERRRHREQPESDVKNLRRRRDELAIDGPAYAVTFVLADRDRTGAAGALLEALKDEWAAEGAVAVLYPATEELMDYYAQRGAAPDQGAQRRMIFNYRRSADQ